MPQKVLLKLLEGLTNDGQPSQRDGFHPTLPTIGIGLDSCVIPLRFGGLSLLQTTDFFYPLVNDPYAMGKIACANVLSDLYAMGVMECDNMLMLLGLSSKFTEEERDIVVPLMLQGFRDLAAEAGTTVTGGQTVVNPWCLIGGVATSVCQQNEFIMPDQAVVGDVLVLTKPLGTQPAVNAFQWMNQKNQHWNRIRHAISVEETEKAYTDAIVHMSRLNRHGARLMHVFGAHAATDVTGFGILGHAENLAKQQRNEVTFAIHNLPVIAKMVAVSKASIINFGLLKGTSAETSGGLLIVLSREQATKYCQQILATEGHPAWIIGVVEKGDRSARIIGRPRIIEVSYTKPENPPTPINQPIHLPSVTQPMDPISASRKRTHNMMTNPILHPTTHPTVIPTAQTAMPTLPSQTNPLPVMTTAQQIMLPVNTTSELVQNNCPLQQSQDLQDQSFPQCHYSRLSLINI